jgi:four helix bundle protein
MSARPLETGPLARGMVVADAGAVASSIICQRAFEFSARIPALCDRLLKRRPVARQVAAQLMKCGTSIGSYAEEAQDGQTKADFIAKLSVSRKESRETIYGLRLAIRTQVATSDELMWELDEAIQLRSMIVSAIKTAQASSRRGR